MKESYKNNSTIFAVCVAVLAGFLSFSLYLPSIKVPFLFDDLLIINPSVDYSGGIRALLENINIFSSRPLLGVTYTLNSVISGTNPEGYHFINIFLHFLNSLMLFFIMRILLLRTSKTSDLLTINIISFSSVIFFLVHPLASESVIYITGRSSLLYSFFILLSFYFFLKAVESEGKQSFLLLIPSLSFFICALASKEIALIFSAILLMAVFFFFYSGKYKKRNILLLLPYAVVSLLLIVIKMPFLLSLSSPDKTIRPFGTHILTEFYIFAHSVIKTAFPVNLNLDPYFDNITTIFDFRFLAGVTLFVISIFIIVYLRDKSPVTAFGIAWFLVSFSPHLVIRLKDYMSERWLYFPLLAIPFIFSHVCLFFFKEAIRRKTLATVCVLFLCASSCCYGFLIINRQWDWKSDIAIWTDTAKKSPEKFRPHANLGFALLGKKRFAEAEKEFQKAISINSEYAEIHYYLAQVYMGTNDEKSALKELEKSLQYLPYYDYADNPVYYNAFINIGVLHFKKGEKQKAFESFISAIRENPERAQAYNNLGILYLSTGELKKAENSFLTALNKDSNNLNAKLNLADIYRQSDKQTR